MPELPEVETLRRELAKVLIGQVIKAVKILWPGVVAPLSPRQFLKKIIGQKIRKVERRAKILLLELNDCHLAIHLKMTGQLIYVPSPHPLQLPPRGRGKQLKVPLPLGEGRGGVNKHTRVIFNFADRSQLYFNDLRKFGWLRLLRHHHRKELSERHGLEPLSRDFTFKKFLARLDRYPQRRLKPFLLDQTLIAGLGNIYADESCFAAGLRPNRRIKTLTNDENKKLYRAITNILRRAISKGGTSSRDYVRSDGSRGGFAAYLKVYGRGGQPCRRCTTPIRKIKLASRGTHYCPGCQR